MRPLARLGLLFGMTLPVACTDAPLAVGTTSAGSTTSGAATTTSPEPESSSGVVASTGVVEDTSTSDSTSASSGSTTSGSTTSDGTTGDADSDGYPTPEDCDDTDPFVYPGAPERCNDIDDDCDPLTGEDGVASVDGQGSFATIGMAVAASSPGSEVRVCAGTWPEHVTIAHDLALVAQRDATVTTIDGGGAGGPTLRVTAGEVTIRGFTITGGNSVGQGGGIGITGTELVTVASCVVTGNTSTDGAGIYTYLGAQLALEQTTLSDNTGGIGGGLAMNGDGFMASLSMTGCTISGNVADENGGGMVLFEVPTVQIDSTTIVDNDSLDGGGITIGGSVVTLTDSSVQRNTASTAGGGLLLYGGIGELASIDSDWGTAANDNTPQDVVVVGVGTWGGYGPGASFVCDVTGCS